MFIRCFFLCFVLFCFSCCNKREKHISEICPSYQPIKSFSKKICPITGLILCSYGVNNYLPKDYKFKNGIANFNATFSLRRTQKDKISLEEARCLIISVTEGFLREINSNLQVRTLLDVYPISKDLVNVGIRFEDENQIDLGSGISGVYLLNGVIEYEGYEIHEYRSKYPSIGKHFVVHNESYTEALDIVKSQDSLIDLGVPITVGSEV